MNTNDEQAPYGKKREPLLSDEDVVMLAELHKPKMTPFEVRDFYENLISEGELRVVKKVCVDPIEHIYECAGVHIMGFTLERINFCPGCGGEIQK